MTEQPEALRLADDLTEAPPGEEDVFAAAAELRRLHYENTTLSKIARLYEELRRVIDDGSESMTHEDAVEDVKVFHRMYEQNTELKKVNAQLLEALEMLDKTAPNVSCEDFHHFKKDRHEYGEHCPVLERYESACLKARAAIAAAKGEA